MNEKKRGPYRSLLVPFAGYDDDANLTTDILRVRETRSFLLLRVNQNTQNQDLLELEQRSQITIRASPVIGRDINIKVKIFKKAFKNIDQDEKAQAKAFKSFKALSL